MTAKEEAQQAGRSCGATAWKSPMLVFVVVFFAGVLVNALKCKKQLRFRMAVSLLETSGDRPLCILHLRAINDMQGSYSRQAPLTEKHSFVAINHKGMMDSDLQKPAPKKCLSFRCCRTPGWLCWNRLTHV